MRVAAADIGTNSTRLLIADVGSRRLRRRGRAPARDHAARRGRRCERNARARCRWAVSPTTLARFAARARELSAERLLAVATSAVRDASNRDDFLARVAADRFRAARALGRAGGVDDVRRRRSRAPGGESRVGRRHARRRRRRGLDGARPGRGRGRRLVALAAGRLRAHDRAVPRRGLSPTSASSPPAPPPSTSCCEVVPDEVVAATRRAIAVAGTATTLAAIQHGGYDARRRARRPHHARGDARAGARLAALPLEQRRERARASSPRGRP